MCLYWKGFEKAIETEVGNLKKNSTWEYVNMKEISRETNILRSKLVFDIKRGPQGEFLKYKARHVACGYTQIEGIDFLNHTLL